MGWLPQRAGSPNLNAGGAAAAVPPEMAYNGPKNDKSTIFEALHDMEYNTVARFPFR